MYLHNQTSNDALRYHIGLLLAAQDIKYVTVKVTRCTVLMQVSLSYGVMQHSQQRMHDKTCILSRKDP